MSGTIDPAIEISSKTQTRALSGDMLYFLEGRLAMDNQAMDAPETTGQFKFKCTKEQFDRFNCGDIIFFIESHIQAEDGKVSA